MKAKRVLWELVGGDVRGAAAVAGGGLGPLDVQVEQLHLWEGNSSSVRGLHLRGYNETLKHSRQVFIGVHLKLRAASGL